MPKPAKEIDFTRGNCWGHALYGATMRKCEAENLAERDADKKAGRRRYSVFVHSREYPVVGDRIVYETERGIVKPRIASVRCTNPSDMFVLEITFERDK